MNADRKVELAKANITFVATSYDAGETAIRAHLAELRAHIDTVEKGLKAGLADYKAAAAERETKANAAAEALKAEHAAAERERRREALAKELAALDDTKAA